MRGVGAACDSTRRTGWLGGGRLQAETLRTTLGFVTKHRGLFLHPERATNRERDGIEGEVGLVVKGVKDGLDSLQERIDEFSRQRGREAPSPHAVAHLQVSVCGQKCRNHRPHKGWDENSAELVRL